MESYVTTDGYTAAEVTWLLSLSYEDALLEDGPRAATFDPIGAGAGEHGARIPTLARWSEVTTARDRVVSEKRDLAAAELLTQGYEQIEVAAILGMSRQTVSRRFRASLDDILNELGGAYEPPEVLSHRALCLICGERPRARAAALTRTLSSGTTHVIRPEREIAVCDECADPDAVRCVTDLVPA